MKYRPPLTTKDIIEIIIALLLTVTICSCYTSKKAVIQTTKANTYYPKEISVLTRSWYPCVTNKQDTIITSKDSLIYIECPDNTPITDYFSKDTIIKVVIKDSLRIIKVPVHLPIQTIHITNTIEDSAKIKELSVTISDKEVAVNQLNKKVNGLQIWRIWLFILLVLSLLGNLFQKFFKI